MDIEEIARVLRDRYGKKTVAGLSDGEIEEVSLDQATEELPGEWREFLSLMGRRTGGLLFQDTDLLYPEILGIKAEALDEFPSLRSRVACGDDLVVVGMYQDREFYVMGGPHGAGSDVVRYIKGEDQPCYGFPSFTALLQYKLSLLPRTGAGIDHSVPGGRREPKPERRPSAFARWRRKGQLW